MNACTSFQRHFTVGPFTVTMTVSIIAGQPVGIECEWSPDLPRRLSKKRKAEYIAKRDTAMAALATAIGGNIIMASPGLELAVKRLQPERPA
jgi:hypothetical protein